MARPKEGYRNAMGMPIPGTHDPIARFMDATALKFWAWKQGKEGKSLFDREAINIGTCVHTMAELDLKGNAIEDIEFYARNTLTDAEDLAKAFASYNAFRAWREAFHVRPVEQEVPLVSEKHQYGGTPDTIAVIGNGLGLIDFKTSGKGDVYPDQLVAMAAHGKLWTENRPGQPLTAGYHLIVLPKDGSPFRHYAYADLKPHWKLFKLYLKAYHLDKACSDKSVLAGVAAPASEQPARTVATAIKAAAQSKPRARPAPAAATSDDPLELPASLRRIKKAATPEHAAPPTLAEMLRAYGHVRAVA